jgi:hypothetical protein
MNKGLDASTAKFLDHYISSPLWPPKLISHPPPSSSIAYAAPHDTWDNLIVSPMRDTKPIAPFLSQKTGLVSPT